MTEASKLRVIQHSPGKCTVMFPGNIKGGYRENNVMLCHTETRTTLLWFIISTSLQSLHCIMSGVHIHREYTVCIYISALLLPASPLCLCQCHTQSFKGYCLKFSFRFKIKSKVAYRKKLTLVICFLSVHAEPKQKYRDAHIRHT